MVKSKVIRYVLKNVGNWAGWFDFTNYIFGRYSIIST